MSLSGSLTLQDIQTLERNVRDAVVVNMANDNYTMTDEESQSSFIIPFNVGDGTKTLTWPSSSASTRPQPQFIYGVGAGNSYTIKAEGNATTASLSAATNYCIAVSDALGAGIVGTLVP
jgi:hypothetical protein